MRTHKKDGTPFTCKFCHQPVAFDEIMCRLYEPDQRTLHVDVCERRKAHFKNQAANAAESRRQNRTEAK